MNKIRILGLDLGSVTCGVALSDELGWYAHPVSTLRYDGVFMSLLPDLEAIITKNQVTIVVLGLPKMLNGDLSDRAQISLEFKDFLNNHFSCEVVLMDERLTTVAANRTLIAADMSRKKRKAVVDQVAAVNILQSYLDRRKSIGG